MHLAPPFSSPKTFTWSRSALRFYEVILHLWSELFESKATRVLDYASWSSMVVLEGPRVLVSELYHRSRSPTSYNSDRWFPRPPILVYFCLTKNFSFCNRAWGCRSRLHCSVEMHRASAEKSILSQYNIPLTAIYYVHRKSGGWFHPLRIWPLCPVKGPGRTCLNMRMWILPNNIATRCLAFALQP